MESAAEGVETRPGVFDTIEMSNRVRFLLDEDRIPRSWYNLIADLPEPLAPVLPSRHRATHRSQ